MSHQVVAFTQKLPEPWARSTSTSTHYFRNAEGKPRNRDILIGEFNAEISKMEPNSNYYELFKITPGMPDTAVWDYGYSYLVHKCCNDIHISNSTNQDKKFFNFLLSLDMAGTKTLWEENMNHIDCIQKSIDYIDAHIMERITVEELAKVSGYSTDYFYRIFNQAVGLSVIEYVKRRKLQHALYQLSIGRKVIEIALDYGYETHSGFTKAFKRCFGYPPNLYRLHAPVGNPNRDVLAKMKQNKLGGIVMQPKILKKGAIKVVGYEFKTTLKGNAHTRDIPAFWNYCDFEGHGYEGKLYTSQQPHTHGEYGLCINLDTESEEFSWVLGVAVDNFDKATSELCTLVIPPATYAIFTTPPVQNDCFVDSITGTWRLILDEWLPNSEYEIDETKLDFEYYDERCHCTEVDKVVMEIYIPIKLKNKN